MGNAHRVVQNLAREGMGDVRMALGYERLSDVRGKSSEVNDGLIVAMFKLRRGRARILSTATTRCSERSDLPVWNGCIPPQTQAGCGDLAKS
ncbi:hypothetical protein KB874_20930 [Aestuariicoccus sp. KMU-90]|uniref:Uncharacterized protein n=1 Tax=Thetidibacter halocola TaxID=2827239 RepID=A0A8J7WK84_9RHOB|nr:hypothetical protein [Thetidibacter halocola]